MTKKIVRYTVHAYNHGYQIRDRIDVGSAVGWFVLRADARKKADKLNGDYRAAIARAAE